MTIENEAFIDLESALHERFDQLWREQWRETQSELTRLANAGDWETAASIAHNISMTLIVDDLRELARTFSEAALFLGASRIDEPQNASFFGNPDERLIDNGVEQWAVVLERNATIAIQTQAELTLDFLERRFAEQELSRIVKADPDLGRVGKAGSQFSRAAASLMISRMSTAGFMIEANARGVQQYRINEVLDGATCPVCEEMNNKTFPVSDGLAQSGAIMNATDPESLKSIAPFPSQSAANVKAIAGMGQGSLVGNGLHLPPYHPNCRGIVSLEVKNREASVAIAGANAARLTSTEGLTQEQLARRMFGDFDDLDDKTLSFALGVGAASDFGDNE